MLVRMDKLFTSRMKHKPVHTIWFDRNWYQRQVCYLKLKQKSFHLTPFSIGKNKNNLDQKKKHMKNKRKINDCILHWLCKQRKESSEMIFSKSVMTALKTQHNWVLVSINSIESSVYHFKWSFEGSVWGCKCSLMFNCSELSFIFLNTCASSLHNKYDRKSYRNSYAAAFPSFQFLI